MEEREMDEMRRLQGKDPSKEKLAWMYAPVGIQNDADEYLMGKPKEAVPPFAYSFLAILTRIDSPGIVLCVGTRGPGAQKASYIKGSRLNICQGLCP